MRWRSAPPTRRDRYSWRRWPCGPTGRRGSSCRWTPRSASSAARAGSFALAPLFGAADLVLELLQLRLPALAQLGHRGVALLARGESEPRAEIALGFAGFRGHLERIAAQHDWRAPSRRDETAGSSPRRRNWRRAVRRRANRRIRRPSRRCREQPRLELRDRCTASSQEALPPPSSKGASHAGGLPVIERELRIDEVQLRKAGDHGLVEQRARALRRGSENTRRMPAPTRGARRRRDGGRGRAGAAAGSPGTAGAGRARLRAAITRAISGPVSGPRRYDSAQRVFMSTGASSCTLRMRNTRCVRLDISASRSAPSSTPASADFKPSMTRSLSRSVCSRPMNHVPQLARPL